MFDALPYLAYPHGVLRKHAQSFRVRRRPGKRRAAARRIASFPASGFDASNAPDDPPSAARGGTHSVEKSLLIMIFIVFVMLIGSATTAYRSMTDSVTATWWVLHTHEVLEELQATLLALKEVEAGGRGYVITGARGYLKPYRLAITAVAVHLARLKMLTAHDGDQPLRWTKAEILVSQKLALTARIIRTRANRGFAAARRLVAVNDGERQMNALRTVFTNMVSTENRRLRGHVVHANFSKERAVTTTLVALPLIFIQLALVFLFVKRHLAGRAATEVALLRLADNDELTRLANRRQVNYRLSDEVARARRYGHSLALIMLDIDHFKTINDTFGHPTGDAVLAWVAEHLRAIVRNTDTPARFGGEEFAVILPETDLQEAFALAERIRRAVAAKPYISAKGAKPMVAIPLTLSAGVTELGGDDGEVDTDAALIAAADQALYQAKRQGRNRTASLADVLDSQMPLSLES